ncbi:ATP-dependent RNA helicase SUV3 homolog, mitochondrial-like isoform X2 [Artemia franciscana]|uniref:ATP-dependent RNA helicase SUV3 homolog, mitochondrial n=1 Tax=Artemia franciscana TaxID=6661 RepID=A0AA88L7P9_ARTSF|nr:hypothetical protein QYM36_010308 [Artemia franciscana]
MACSRIRIPLLQTWAVSRQLVNITAKKDKNYFSSSSCFQKRKKEVKQKSLSQLIVPVPIAPNPDDINAGAEIAGMLPKEDLLRLLNQFQQSEEIKLLAAENGLDAHLFHQAFLSFRRFCIDGDAMPTELHIVISDILAEADHVHSLFPYYYEHARKVFPHLDCVEDLKKISDLTIPASWYPEARAMNRQFIFHAGPTNSGKTYHAMQRFLTADSGIYCGPLKLLASEVYQKSNELGTPCDLVTGEERKRVNPNGDLAKHVACTVEMASISDPYDVAVIDEIQMVRDSGRGWAWTRAILGIQAKEVHVCGEGAAIDILSELAFTCGESIEVRRYKRLTEMSVEDQALRSIDRVRPGDCIVCFNKQDIYWVCRQVEALGREVAVIYGSLPPGAKLAQAAKFNDPNHPCKVLVATDAIGMGLNLNIGRVIFFSLLKPTVNEKGEKEIDLISPSQALQIAGRAGRYGTQFSHGYVTTYKPEDLPTLNKLLSTTVEPIVQAGLHPTAEQIEMYAYHLPQATLSNLMDIFIRLCTVDDSLYFLCNIDDFKFLAEMIEHIPLPLRARYVFCCAPINRKVPFVCTMFLKFARQYSRNEAMTFDWLCRQIGWPISPPSTIQDLVHLEAVFDVLDLYLWLSYRFPDLFPSSDMVRDMQKELDEVIQKGVQALTRLVHQSTSTVSSEDTDSVVAWTKKRRDIIPEDVQPAALGRLSQRLMEQGLLTPRLLAQLQEEWKQQQLVATTEREVEQESALKKRSKQYRFIRPGVHGKTK